jgi:hypothetical protein
MYNSEKIGLSIITYNSENYFKSLYETIPLKKIDELVVVNGGNKYQGNYECSWIQHNINYYPAVCRNDGVNFLLNRDCTHIFQCEDDMLIKNPEIFNEYIKASKISGLKYFSFASMSWESGSPFNRTPRLTVNYSEDVAISFYKNMCNEFTYHHKSSFEKSGLYDTQFRDPFDIDMAYRESQQDYCPPFWYFPDIKDSDEYIMNNPNATSRLQASDRPDGSREQRIQQQWELFHKKHNLFVNQIPDTPQENVIKKLKSIKP